MDSRKVFLGVTIALAASAAACTATPAVAERGDTVEVAFTGTLADGSVFDEAPEANPLRFTIGDEIVIPQFEKAVEGLLVGEHVTIRLEPAEAFGAYDPNLVVEVPDDGAPADLQEGDRVTFDDGRSATVLEIRDGTVLLDGNHELAGEELTYEIELLEVRD